jgi:N-methylhydantoinase A/oxoprolinase/acetone carboxylase beta subunit
VPIEPNHRPLPACILCPLGPFFFAGSRAILSGPAGGVVGYGMTSYGKVTDRPVIGFDMGGTSTDVSRFAGVYVCQ